MEYQFERLNAWQESRKLVVAVYRLLKKFPEDERFALCNQLRRAVISIPSNIAEGMGRFSVKERIHFIDVSNGSLMEVMCQLEIANKLGYISTEVLQEQEAKVATIAKMIIGLRNNLEEKIK